MNGVPGQILIAIGISSRSVEQIDVYEGISWPAESIMSIWQVVHNKLLTGLLLSYRNCATQKFACKEDGAKPNDLICVTEFLPFMGLRF
jgi:hypothetical protein